MGYLAGTLAVVTNGRSLIAILAVGLMLRLGWALAHSNSPQYRERQALLQVKILLEPRLYVASADILGFPR